jgi:outer membrane immunogenic protein
VAGFANRESHSRTRKESFDMKLLCTAAISAAVLMTASTAYAQGLANFGNTGSYAYAGLGYSHYSASSSGEDFALSAITGRLGFMFNPFIGIEGEGSFGLGDDTIDFGGGSSGSVRIESDWAGYLIGMFPLGNDNFNLFGRLGYGTLGTKVKFAGISDSGRDDQWRVGFGAQGFLDGVNGFRAEYTNLGWLDDDDNGADVDVWSISYIRRFR